MISTIGDDCKIGFGTPEAKWLTSLRPWVDAHLTPERLARVPAIDARALRPEWDGVLAGQRRFGGHIWRCLNVLAWVERFDIMVPG